MRKQLYKIKGLDLRSNELYRREGTARDLANTRLDLSGNLLKREDFAAEGIPKGINTDTGLFLDKIPFTTVILGMIEDYIDDYILLVCYDDGSAEGFQACNFLYKWYPDTNTIEKVETQANVASATFTGARPASFPIIRNLSYVIQNNIVYFTGESNSNDDLSFIYKFDGDNWHVSGVSKVGENITVAADFIRTVPMTIDAQGRFTFGDYTQGKGAILGGYQIIEPKNQLTGSSLVDLFRSVAFFDHAQTKTVAWDGNVANRTFNYSSVDPYLELGQHLLYVIPYVPVDYPATLGVTYVRVEVIALDKGANTVEIGNFQSYDGSKWIDASGDNEIDIDVVSGVPFSSRIVLSYSSITEFSGYTLRGVVTFKPQYPVTIGYGTIDLTGLDFAGPVATNFEDFYAEDFVKNVPPRCHGTLAIYRNTLITHDKEFIYLSDNYSGGNQEDFVPSDSYLIGKSDKGPINAVFANETFVAVFRENEAYYLSGNVITGQFRDLAYRSTKIGCVSGSGIVDLAGGAFFPSKRGFHLAQPSGRLNDISDNIEPMFISNALGYFPNLADCITKIDFNREYVVIYIPTSDNINGENIALLYSYYHNEWFLYRGLDMNGGFYVKSGKIYYSDGTDIFVESSVRVNAIDAYYRGNFDIMGDAALWKKFLRAKLYTIKSPATELTLKTYSNWDEADTEGLNATQNIADGDNFCVKKFPKTNAQDYSMSLEFGSTGTNDMKVNGYEIEFEREQTEYDDTKPNQ